MDPKESSQVATTPTPTISSSEHPPGLTSASSSPPSSQDEEVNEDLEQLRRRNEEKLQGRFQSIYAKYGRDFGEVSDEIDLVTGQVTVSNGHLKLMRHERDVGPPLLFHALQGEDASDEQHEYLDDSEANHSSIASIIDANPATWSKPGAFDQYFNNVSKDRVVELVQNAVEDQTDVDSNDSSFVEAFSQKIVQQVARLMHTLKSSEVDDLKSILPSVLEQQLLKKNNAPTNNLEDTNMGLNDSIDRTVHDRPANSTPPQVGTSKWEPSIWEDAEFSFTPSRSNSPGIDDETASPTKRGPSRRGIVRWTKQEDEWLVALKSSGTLTYREISRRFPNRSYRAVRQRFRALVGRDPDILSSAADIDLSLDSEQGQSTTPDLQKSPSLPTPSESKPDQTHYSSKRTWTAADDELLVNLREKEKLTWPEVANYFPGRSSDAVSWRYYFRLQKGARIPIKKRPDKPQDDGLKDNAEKEEQNAEAELGLGSEAPVGSEFNATGDISNLDVQSTHDSGCSFVSNDVEMDGQAVDASREAATTESMVTNQHEDQSAPISMEISEPPCGHQLREESQVGSDLNGENQNSKHESRRRSNVNSKKRKRPSAANDLDRNIEKTLSTTPPAAEIAEGAAIPIDPMLLESHIRTSTSLSSSQQPQPHHTYQVSLSRDAPDNSGNVPHQTNLISPHSEQAENYAPPPQQQYNANASSPAKTPSRQSQWSLSDAMALMKNNKKPSATTSRCSSGIKLGSTMNDFDDGLGSEDELGL